ncbi:MAG: glycosyltransferase family 2 protein [Selenomonadaceae bacterium]|nr:glycosyltransferase family 2 protein [Selenomonadaceae bacterium]
MTPAVSVIIPLYNAEKYLAECLDSILNQTFQNFEVIVVDDCSTDSSCAVVENYIPKFDGRLTLAHMEKNSGSGALPRNKGFELSRGEYVFFMDADDMLIETALEELYTLAKDYAAEVVYCEKYYRCDAAGENIKVDWMQRGTFVDKPTFDTENLAERVKGIVNRRYWVTPWSKLVRRDLIVKSGVHFPHCR